MTAIGAVVGAVVGVATMLTLALILDVFGETAWAIAVTAVFIVSIGAIVWMVRHP